MKKCGAKPIVDTYVQLAHAINTLNTHRPEGTSVNIKSTLTLITRFIDETFSTRDINSHRGIGVFFAILRSAVLAAVDGKQSDERERIVDAARWIWDVGGPYTKDSKMHDDDIHRALQNYLCILKASEVKEVWKIAATLLPRLLAFPPSNISRNIAISLGLQLKDSSIVEPFWRQTTLPKIPLPEGAQFQDDRNTQMELVFFSQPELADPKRALAALNALIADIPPGSPPLPTKHFVLALLSCIPSADVHVAWSIYRLMSINPIARHDFGAHALLLDIFARARYIWRQRQYTAGAIYKPVFSSDISRFFDDESVTVQDRYDLARKFIKIIGWRLNQPFSDSKYRERVERDYEQYKKLEEEFKRKSRRDDLERGVKKRREPKVTLLELGRQRPVRVIETDVRTGDKRTVFKYARAPKPKPKGTRAYSTVAPRPFSTGFLARSPLKQSKSSVVVGKYSHLHTLSKESKNYVPSMDSRRDKRMENNLEPRMEHAPRLRFLDAQARSKGMFDDLVDEVIRREVQKPLDAAATAQVRARAALARLDLVAVLAVEHLVVDLLTLLGHAGVEVLGGRPGQAQHVLPNLQERKVH